MADEDKTGFINRLRNGYNKLVSDYYKWLLKRAGEWDNYCRGIASEDLSNAFEDVEASESSAEIYGSAEILCAELDRLYDRFGKTYLHGEADELFERKGLYDKKSDSHYTLQT